MRNDELKTLSFIHHSSFIVSHCFSVSFLPDEDESGFLTEPLRKFKPLTQTGESNTRDFAFQQQAVELPDAPSHGCFDLRGMETDMELN
jgi:hypothetical protein